MSGVRVNPLVLAGALLLPGIVFAATPMQLDLTSGAPKEILGTTLGLARGFMVLSFLLALLIEAFGRAPAAPRDFGGVLFRALVVLLLLSMYPTVFGSVINLAEGVATRVTPTDTFDRAKKQMQDFLTEVQKQKADVDAAAARGSITPNSAMGQINELAMGAVGGVVFDALMTMAVAIGQAAHWVLGALARVLLGVLYVLGPLALVFSIPRTSNVGGRWFQAFVTVACWPVLSGLIVAMVSAVVFTNDQATDLSSAFGSLATALLLAATAVAVPRLATALIAGSVENLVAHGADAMMARARSARAALIPKRMPSSNAHSAKTSPSNGSGAAGTAR